MKENRRSCQGAIGFSSPRAETPPRPLLSRRARVGVFHILSSILSNIPNPQNQNEHIPIVGLKSRQPDPAPQQSQR